MFCVPRARRGALTQRTRPETGGGVTILVERHSQWQRCREEAKSRQTREAQREDEGPSVKIDWSLVAKEIKRLLTSARLSGDLYPTFWSGVCVDLLKRSKTCMALCIYILLLWNFSLFTIVLLCRLTLFT